jgi:isoprenylcysteine carboxyl methyltransferase (ICMT) family protein YpbQ
MDAHPPPAPTPSDSHRKHSHRNTASITNTHYLSSCFHPNYTAVAAEVAALPLVHSAWLTAIVFSVANARVLNVRIGAGNAALGYA